MKKIITILVLGFLFLCGSEVGAQMATPPDSSTVAGWEFTTFTDVDDSLKAGYQIYQKIDTTDAVIDSAIGAERAAVAAKADSASGFTHDGIKDYHVDWGTGTGQVSTDDVTEGSSNLFDQALPDSSDWSTAYSWGDHSGQNYLNEDDLGNWKVFYSNGTGAFTEVTLGAEGTYLKSNGASSAPTFATPPGGDPGSAIDDSIKNGLQIYQKIDTTNAVIDSAVGAERAAVAASVDEVASSVWAGRVSDETGTPGGWVFSTSPTFTTDITSPLIIGGTATTSDLSLKTTSGVGETGADMHFLVGNNGATEAMTILNNGYVGIGINSPSSILHVKASVPGVIGSHSAGQLIIQNPANSVYANAVITGYESDGGGNPDQQLWYLGGSSGSNSDVTLLNRRNSKLHLGADGATKMTILGDGNVGIGTLNPPERLSIVGNIATGDSTTGDVDVFHYFSTDGSWVTEYLKWDDGLGEFQFSDDLTVTGDAYHVTSGEADSAYLTHGGAAATYVTATLTEEEVEDFVGGMLGGTETNITVTYEDASNDIDFVVDSEPWDSLTAWANKVNAAIDSLAAWTSLINEAKDSLTSWANEVNASTDSLAAWTALINEAKDSLTSWANQINAATDSLANWTSLVNEAKDSLTAWANKVNDILPLTKCYVIQSPDTDHDFPFWMTPVAITLIAVSGVCIDGTNAVGQLMEYDNDAANPVVCNSSDWTFTTGEERTTSFTNASIDAGDWLGWKTTSVSGEVSFLSLTIEYTQP